ncbi:MAG: hypothetical protein ACOYD9_00860 [Pyramidobacter sp.]|jgi:hypothetical protein
MVKRLFETLALVVLAILGLKKLNGKKVNPLALRILLAILSFMAYCVGSAMILMIAGTWLLFLLAGDVGSKFGVDLRLFVPVPADGTHESLADDAEKGSTFFSLMKTGAKRCKSLVTGLFFRSEGKK